MSRLRESRTASANNNQMSPCSSSVLLTLPIACQICLGKVKEPTVCPNQHVFCFACLNQWLKSCSMCPSCRIPITENQPYKRIIGSMDTDAVATEDSPSVRAQLRRTRMEVLVLEYESDFSRIDMELDKALSENCVLNKQNETLRRSLEASEEKLIQMINKSNTKDVANDGNQVPNDINTVLLLSSKLHGFAQKNEQLEEQLRHLEQEVKAGQVEKARLTQELGFLRDESMQSPRKHSRYTVMALQAKLDSYEREVQQLKRALSRSDEFTEHLQSQIVALRQGERSPGNNAPSDAERQGRSSETLVVTSSNGAAAGPTMESPNATGNECEDNSDLVVRTLPPFYVTRNGDLTIMAPSSSHSSTSFSQSPHVHAERSSTSPSQQLVSPTSPCRTMPASTSPERPSAPDVVSDNGGASIDPYSDPTLYPACAKLIQLTRAHQSSHPLAPPDEEKRPPLLNKPTSLELALSRTQPSGDEWEGASSSRSSRSTPSNPTHASTPVATPPRTGNGQEKRKSSPSETQRLEKCTPSVLKRMKTEPPP